MNQNNNNTVSGNKNNFKTIIYNRSLDNKYRKEKYFYLNYNYFRINTIKDIKKKVYGTIDNKRRTEQNSNSPLMTGAFNEQRYIDNSLMVNTLNNGYLEKSKNKNKKNVMKLNKRKKEEKIDMNGSNQNKNNRINNYNNYYLMNKNNSLKKNFVNSSVFNNTNAMNNLKLKKNNFLIEDINMNKTKYKNKIIFSLSQEKERKDKKIKTKKASSFSIDLNLKYNNKNEYNIYTNRPKRKNVMKFVNKNNMNLRIRNLYNNYGYCYRKENKNIINNKSLDL